MDEREKFTPKWLANESGNRTRAKRSNTAERRVASALGGKRIARSGAKSWSASDYKTTDRGDIQTPLLHVEHKRTDRASMSLQREWLEKVTAGARRTDRAPALVVTFDQPHQPPQDWLMLPLEVARRLLGIEVDDG